MMDESAGAFLLGGLVLGFLGSAHCLGMCGGIAGALAQAGTKGANATPPLPRSILYSLGRLTSYSVLGALVGTIGSVASSWLEWSIPLRIAAGLLIVLFGMQALGWLPRAPRLERLGLAAWRRLSPVIARIGPPDRPAKVFLVGALWGWLPCGLVYSALAASAVAADPILSAAFMAAFGIGTSPALILTGSAATSGRRWFVGPERRQQLSSALLILFGLWTAYAAVVPMMAGHGGHAGHAIEATESSEGQENSPAPQMPHQNHDQH